MAKNNDDVFQERVDELLLMERRIDQRTRQLTEYNDNLQKKVNAATEKIDGSANIFDVRASDKIDRLIKFQDVALKSTKELAKYNKQTMLVFMVMTITVGVMFVWAILRLGYLNGEIDVAKTKLAELDLKLSQTPIIEERYGKYYVKLVPNSEMRLCEELATKWKKAKFGTYAEMWQGKR